MKSSASESLGRAQRAEKPIIASTATLTTPKGERKGQFSIRINDQYRFCFRWTNEGPTDVELVDYR
jgi:proteic killer suppression protein